MKKKIVTLLLAGSLVLSNSAIAFAAPESEAGQSEVVTTAVENTVVGNEETTPVETEVTTEEGTKETEVTEGTTEEKEEVPVVEEEKAEEEAAAEVETEYQYVSPAEAVADTKGVIIDLRVKADWEAAHIRGSVHSPIFTMDNGTKNPAGNYDGFVKDMTAKKAEYEGKNILLLCYSGNKGAQNATAALKECGYDMNKVFTIEGGAGASGAYLDYYVSNQEAMDAYLAGTATVIDLRAQEAYDAGHLKAITYLPVFVNIADKPTLEGAEAEKLQADFEKNIVAVSNGKPIYVLCYTGNKGAQKAIDLAVKAGIARNNVKIIAGGAAAEPFATGNACKYVSGEKAVADLKAGTATVIDLRARSDYESAHLKGALYLPVFGEGPSLVINDADVAQEAFLKYAKANKDELNKKPVYVLCYAGNKGALKASLLLAEAGVKNVFTITDGAKADAVKAASRYVADTLAVNPGENGLVIDVRNSGLYAAGHLAGSLSLPVFDKDNKLDTEVALAAQKAFREYVEAHKAELAAKNLYILCNSGNRGAELATEILAEYGIKENVYTIEGGAKSTLIQSKFVKDSKPETKPETKPEETKKPSKNPQTGDPAMALQYTVAMGAAALALVKRKKWFDR